MQRSGRCIFLVGFMGTGKTTVAEILARELKGEGVDLDARIEQCAGRSIADIFAAEGEAHFRLLEQEALHRVCRENNVRVVACGGGIMLDPANIRVMKDTGWIICLTARPEVIWERVKQQTQRPLLRVADPQERIRALLRQRQSAYQQADATVDTSERTPEQVAGEVLSVVNAEQ